MTHFNFDFGFRFSVLRDESSWAIFEMNQNLGSLQFSVFGFLTFDFEFDDDSYVWVDVKVDGPGESRRSNWVKVNGPKRQKVDGLRKWTVHKSKLDGPKNREWTVRRIES